MLAQATLVDELRRVTKHVTFRVVFRVPVKSGQKRYTLRNYRIAKAGEIVSTNFGPIRILSVVKQAPRFVGEFLFREEGFESPAAFFDMWSTMHPADDVDKPRFLHYFEFLGDPA